MLAYLKFVFKELFTTAEKLHHVLQNTDKFQKYKRKSILFK